MRVACTEFSRSWYPRAWYVDSDLVALQMQSRRHRKLL